MTNSSICPKCKALGGLAPMPCHHTQAPETYAETNKLTHLEEKTMQRMRTLVEGDPRFPNGERERYLAEAQAAYIKPQP